MQYENAPYKQRSQYSAFLTKIHLKFMTFKEIVFYGKTYLTLNLFDRYSLTLGIRLQLLGVEIKQLIRPCFCLKFGVLTEA